MLFRSRVLDNRSIEQLPRPFAVVATERADKRMTVFNRGNAGLAVRASASIPDVFWPVLIGGVEYVDGGLTSRVPVARRMGADVVVAVDVSWRGSDEVGQADVPVRPDTPRTRSLDFSAKIESIAAGGGRPALDQTLNYLSHMGTPLTLVASDPLKSDLYYRYNQSLQEFVNASCAFDTEFPLGR